MMFKQLVQHDGNGAYQVVDTSGDLQTPDEVTAWESSVAVGKTLPAGYTWGIIDQNHAWFDDSKLPKPEPKTYDPTKPLTPDQVLEIESSPKMRDRFRIEE